MLIIMKSLIITVFFRRGIKEKTKTSTQRHRCHREEAEMPLFFSASIGFYQRPQRQKKTLLMPETALWGKSVWDLVFIGVNVAIKSQMNAIYLQQPAGYRNMSRWPPAGKLVSRWRHANISLFKLFYRRPASKYPVFRGGKWYKEGPHAGHIRGRPCCLVSNPQVESTWHKTGRVE